MWHTKSSPRANLFRPPSLFGLGHFKNGIVIVAKYSSLLFPQMRRLKVEGGNWEIIISLLRNERHWWYKYLLLAMQDTFVTSTIQQQRRTIKCPIERFTLKSLNQPKQGTVIKVHSQTRRPYFNRIPCHPFGLPHQMLFTASCLILCLFTANGLGQPTTYSQVRLQMPVKPFEPIVGMSDQQVEHPQMVNDDEILRKVNTKGSRSIREGSSNETLESLIEWINSPRKEDSPLQNVIDVWLFRPSQLLLN